MSAETSYSVTQAQLASSQKYPPKGGKAVVLLCGSQWGSSRLLYRRSECGGTGAPATIVMQALRRGPEEQKLPVSY